MVGDYLNFPLIWINYYFKLKLDDKKKLVDSITIDGHPNSSKNPE